MLATVTLPAKRIKAAKGGQVPQLRHYFGPILEFLSHMPTHVRRVLLYLAPMLIVCCLDADWMLIGLGASDPMLCPNWGGQANELQLEGAAFSCRLCGNFDISFGPLGGGRWKVVRCVVGVGGVVGDGGVI